MVIDQVIRTPLNVLHIQAVWTVRDAGTRIFRLRGRRRGTAWLGCWPFPGDKPPDRLPAAECDNTRGTETHDGQQHDQTQPCRRAGLAEPEELGKSALQQAQKRA